MANAPAIASRATYTRNVRDSVLKAPTNAPQPSDERLLRTTVVSKSAVVSWPDGAAEQGAQHQAAQRVGGVWRHRENLTTLYRAACGEAQRMCSDHSGREPMATSGLLEGVSP